MRRQLMGVLVAATVMMGGVIKAQAAEPLGSLHVILGQTEKPASVTLYHVGEPAEDGYRIVDSCGGGFVFIGALLTVLFCLVLLVLYLTGFAQKSTSRHDLRILLPESLNFTGLFDDLFETYTTSHVLTRVKTTAMGSMYELTYSVTLKQQGQEKAFMDEIRVRNSNLTVTLTSPLRNPEEL